MGQYGLSIYSRSVYGMIGTASGTYTSNIINPPKSGFVFTGGLSMVSKVTDAMCTYTYDNTIFEFDNNWSIETDHKKSTVNNATVSIYFTGGNAALNYSGTGITYTISKYNIDTSSYSSVTSGTLPSHATLIDTDELPITSYGSYMITITAPLNSLVKAINVFTNCVSIKLRTATTTDALNNASYVDLTPGAETRTSYKGDGVRITPFDASMLDGNVYYQFQVTLYCSDDTIDAALKELQIESVNNILYMDNGHYEVVVDMTKATPSFKSYTTMNWDAVVPSGTTFSVTTQSSPNNSIYSYVTPQYTMGTMQLRLMALETDGYYTTDLFDIPFRQLISAVNIGSIFSSDCINKSSVKYYFIIDGKQSKAYDYSVINLLQEKIDISNKDIKIKVEISKDKDAITPYVSPIYCCEHCNYIEVKTSTNKSVSAVEGYKDILKVSDLGFLVPTLATNPTYIISYLDASPNYVLYFKSTDINGISKSTTVSIQRGADDTISVYSKLQISLANKRITKIYCTGPDTKQELPILNTLFDMPLVTGKHYLYKVCIGKGVIQNNGEINEIDILSTTITSGVTATFKDPVSYSDCLTMHSTYNGFTDNDLIVMDATFDTQLAEIDWTSSQAKLDQDINSFGIFEPVSVNVEQDSFPEIEKMVYVDNKDLATSVKIDDQTYSVGPYTMSIVPNSVNYVIDESDYILAPNNDIKITSVTISTTDVIEPDIIVRGAELGEDGNPSNIDKLSWCFCGALVNIASLLENGSDGSYSQYVSGLDYNYDSNSGCIEWLTSNKPATGSKYRVYYHVSHPTSAVISFECDSHENKSDTISWFATNSYVMSGECSVGQDYTSEDLNTIIPKNEIRWPEIASDIMVDGLQLDSLQYTVSTIDNLFVMTYMKNDKAIGTLGKMKPSDMWMLNTKSGYYYLGRDEYYKYNNVNEQVIDDNIPITENCSYTNGTDNGGAIVSHDKITSYALNNNFEILENRVSYSSTFPSTAITANSTSKIQWK